MAKLQSTFRNMFLSLFIICLTVAVLLAQVNKMTAKPIADARAMKLQNAIKEVVPAFDNDPVAEAYRMPDTQGDSLLIYPAKMGENCLLYSSPIPRDRIRPRMPSSACNKKAFGIV